MPGKELPNVSILQTEYSGTLVDEFAPIKESRLEAMNDAIRLGHSAYDMLYLILARKMGATLVTLDRRLGAIARKEGIDAVLPE